MPRLKVHLQLNDSGVWTEDSDPDGTIVLRSTEQTIDGRWNIEKPARLRLTEQQRLSATLKAGDLVMTKSSGSSAHIGKTTLVTQKLAELGCCFSNFIQRMRLDINIDPTFLWYYLNSESGHEQLLNTATTTTGLANLNATSIGNCRVPTPPINEQHIIVRYLDHTDQLISRYISAKERLIALLEEQRQAVIHQAVTRGLDQHAPTKPSGVPWIGEIPCNWDVRRLRTLADISTGGRDTINSVENAKYPFFVRSQTVERIDSWSFDGEAVLTAGDGVGVGRVFHYVNGKFDYHQRVYKFSGFANIAGRLFYHYFNAMLRFQTSQGTAKSTVDSLRLPMLQNFPVVVPPLSEQTLLIEEIDRVNANTEDAIKLANNQINLVKQYRTRLIADVVTGQIDVRDAVVELPGQHL